MNLFLTARHKTGLHSVRVFPERASRHVQREVEVLEGVGLEIKVFTGTKGVSC